MKDSWCGKDKWLHCGVSFAVTAAVWIGTGALWYAAAVAAGCGLGKEVWDWLHGGKISLLDLGADLVGIGAAAGAAGMKG